MASRVQRTASSLSSRHHVSATLLYLAVVLYLPRYIDSLITVAGNGQVPMEKVRCRFPEWTQGKWEKAKIDGNIFRYRDAQNDHQTLTSTCVQRQNINLHDRFIVNVRSQW